MTCEAGPALGHKHRAGSPSSPCKRLCLGLDERCLKRLPVSSLVSNLSSFHIASPFAEELQVPHMAEAVRENCIFKSYSNIFTEVSGFTQEDLLFLCPHALTQFRLHVNSAYAETPSALQTIAEAAEDPSLPCFIWAQLLSEAAVIFFHQNGCTNFGPLVNGDLSWLPS